MRLVLAPNTQTWYRIRTTKSFKVSISPCCWHCYIRDWVLQPTPIKLFWVSLCFSLHCDESNGSIITLPVDQKTSDSCCMNRFNTKTFPPCELSEILKPEKNKSSILQIRYAPQKFRPPKLQSESLLFNCMVGELNWEDLTTNHHNCQGTGWVMIPNFLVGLQCNGRVWRSSPLFCLGGHSECSPGAQ